ncbi:hypothetical protein BDD39_002914 [Saccharococcus thermophilus]|uniref:Uncharacterized protein n=1 Tax=Saccharococcus thermophilus TaxID=29396 RepID=A0A846MLA8_9BACL|nr:hypothetical protein [Saccharococcus thermophilus]
MENMVTPLLSASRDRRGMCPGILVQKSEGEVDGYVRNGE